MRITNKYLSDHLLTNLNRNLNQLQNTQQQLSSGKILTKPSDDPVRANQSLGLATSIADNDQYVRNIDFTTAWMETTDSTIGQHVDALQRTRELAVRGASGSLSDTDRRAIAAEVDQLKEQVRGVANTQYGGRFIFGGYQTYIPPSADNPNGELYPSDVSQSPNDAGTLDVELNPGSRLTYNTTGVSLFGDTTTSDNVFQVLDDLSTDLKNGDGASVSASLGELDKWIDVANQERAIVGGKSSRLELSKNRLLDVATSLMKLRSENDEVDMAQTISNLNMQQNVYQAALSVGAKVLQPTLMDFLN